MRRAVIGIVCLLFAAPGAFALTLELNSFDYPERREIDVSLSPGPGGPDASISADVTYRDGQAQIEVLYEDMKPAILYGGDVTCYVAWAVTPGGVTDNLGEFLASDSRGRNSFATAQKGFALIVTAEPFFLVREPSELVVFTSDPSASKRVPSTPFEFSGFVEAPEHAMDGIANISWDSKVPLQLLQARKAVEIAQRLDAEEHAAEFFAEASESLELANAQYEKSPSSRKLKDYARRSVALSNEAINMSLHRIEGLELDKEIATRRAEMAELEERAAEAEAGARKATEEAEKATADAEKAQDLAARLAADTEDLLDQKEALEGELSGLQSETKHLTSALEGALAHVSQTQSTARGFVVNLPGILFDLNEATLKPEAKVALAKLAGILLIVQDFKIQVEGHTDNTGTPDYNLDLSKRRAESVVEFMAGEGVELERMVAVGFGQEQPIGDNDTPDGRGQNRRVEVIISES